MGLGKTEGIGITLYLKPGTSGWTVTVFMLAIAFIVFVSSAPVWARGGGGSGGGRGSGGYRGGRSTSQMGREVSSRVQRRERTHATEQQGTHYHTCVESAEQVRSRVREMHEAAKASGFSREEAQQYRNQLVDEIHTMERSHQQFVEGLNEGQREQIQERIQNINRDKKCLNEQVQAMDHELKQENFRSEHVAHQAGEIQQCMKDWQKENTKIGSDLGL